MERGLLRPVRPSVKLVGLTVHNDTFGRTKEHTDFILPNSNHETRSLFFRSQNSNEGRTMDVWVTFERTGTDSTVLEKGR